MLNKILIKKSDSQIRCKKNAQLHVEEKKEKETTSQNTPSRTLFQTNLLPIFK
jgi:hypothetical protein